MNTVSYPFVKALLFPMIEFLPFKKSLCKFGALLHPLLKSRLTQNVFGRLQKRGCFSTKDVITTNLGIHSRLKIQLPTDTAPQLLYGVPTNYYGERGALRLAAALSSDSKAFIDIGAYKGYYTYYLWATHQGKFPIFFFEPAKDLYSNIQTNVERNTLTGITGMQIAIGKETTRRTFHLNLEDPTCSSLIQVPTIHPDRTETIEIDVLSFADFVAQHSLQELLVKVDIENAEYEFLDGAEKEWSQIKYLIMEVLLPAAKKGFIKTVIDRFGMHAYYICDYKIIHTSDGHFDYVSPEYNFLFCRLSPSELTQRLKGFSLEVVTNLRS